MVDPQGVADLELPGDPLEPPGIAVLRHLLPVEQGVAPQLAVRSEAVGRTAGHFGGPARLVQLELFRVGPHVGAVQGHIDGQVPQDGDPLPVDVPLQIPPLGVKEVLHPFPEVDLPGQLLSGRLQGGGLPQADLLRPLQPGDAAILVFQGHEQGVVLQPVRAPKGAPHLELVPPSQPGDGQTQDIETVPIEGLIVHPLGIPPPVYALILSGLQQSPSGQDIQVDEIGVARKGGVGLIGGVAVAGGAERQDLPAALAPRRQEIDERPGLCPHGPHAPGGGQRKDGHQDPRFPHDTAAFLTVFPIIPILS